MSAFGARSSRGGTCIVLIALSTALFASCSSTTDAPFAFDLSAIAHESTNETTVSPDMAFVFDGDNSERTDTRTEATTGTQETQQDVAEQSQSAAAKPQKDDETGGSFLSAFFSSPSSESSAASRAAQSIQAAPAEPSDLQGADRQTDASAEDEAGTADEDSDGLIATASTGPLIQEGSSGTLVEMDALPGVRSDSLFEITRRSGLEDDDDIDLYEGTGSYQVASAAGLARLAPNGLLKQHGNVETACLKPALVRKLKTIERHFGQRAIITSGYRSPEHNRRVRGARNSLHMSCAAADIQVAGVSKHEVARFARALPGRGGVGTYCHTESVHVDIGPERDWNWRCGRRR